jgi:lipopolysaccharide transport system ATP-binding protein
MAPGSLTARDLGVRFLFNSEGEVVTPLRARFSLRTSKTWGLRHASTAIGAGEGVALIGATGSGKTTLLRSFAGVMPADEGEVRVEGWVGSMLSIDAGLLPDLTGRENAVLLAVLAGMSRAEAKARVEAIKERSRLGDAFDRPASTYSQGMRARLGFSAAMAGDPDVILLDEVHEALDHEFREELGQAIADHRARGGIALAAGHDHEILSRMLPRALLLEGGRIVADGPFEEVRERYLGGGRAEPLEMRAG